MSGYRNIHWMAWLVLPIVCAGFFSCRKYLDLSPPADQLTSANVFASDQSATAAMLAVYARMESDGLAYMLMVNGGISSDECSNYRSSTAAREMAANTLLPSNMLVEACWTDLYKYIYQTNAVLAGVETSTSLSLPVKNLLKGEALFTRSFLYYYLAGLFENIPFHTGTDALVNAAAVQWSRAACFERMTADLEQAIPLLPTAYVDASLLPTHERVRPNRYAAIALQARVELYRGRWQQAENAAASVIAASVYELLTDHDKVFLKNSREAVWQWQAVVPGFNTYAGAYIPTAAVPTVFSLAASLVDSFETGDLRRLKWTRNFLHYVHPFKYKAGQNAPAITEYTMVMRVAELYLVRAEARARQNKLVEALDDLNRLRARSGLQSIAVYDRDALLRAIWKERQLEFFAEFGDRWIDLQRTGQADRVMPVVKGAAWSATDLLYPIPQVELDRNPRLVQNPGY